MSERRIFLRAPECMFQNEMTNIYKFNFFKSFQVEDNEKKKRSIQLFVFPSRSKKLNNNKTGIPQIP